MNVNFISLIKTILDLYKVVKYQYRIKEQMFYKDNLNQPNMNYFLWTFHILMRIYY